MTGSYRGLYLVGNKAQGRTTDVHVVDADGSSLPLPLSEYIHGGIEPKNYMTLPWQEDVPPRAAVSKSTRQSPTW